MRQAAVWVTSKVGRVALAVGGFVLLALAVGAISALFGEKSFPAPFDYEEQSFGRFAWQLCVVLLGCWLTWQICARIVVRLDGYDAFLRMAGELQDEPHDPHAERLARELAQPLPPHPQDSEPWPDEDEALQDRITRKARHRHV